MGRVLLTHPVGFLLRSTFVSLSRSPSERRFPMPQHDIGLIGLAVMGQNLVLNMANHGFSVAVYNRTTATTDEFVGVLKSEPADKVHAGTPRHAAPNWTARHDRFKALARQHQIDWVFLGDSLTEGLGSRRATYVSEPTDPFEKRIVITTWSRLGKSALPASTAYACTSTGTVPQTYVIQSMK